MFSNEEKKYIVLTRNNLLKWVKERILRDNNFEAVILFFYEKIFYYYEYFVKLIINKESKNKLWMNLLIKKYKIY